MELFILWLGFFGSWFLFAGPIYQAALELQEQDIETDRIRATGKKVVAPKRISAWWWLFPPAKFWLERRRSEAYRRAYVKALVSEDVEALMSFFNKATAWVFVAIGGIFIAAKETYELSEAYNWGGIIVWVIIAVMAILSISNTTFRIARTNKIIAKNK